MSTPIAKMYRDLASKKRQLLRRSVFKEKVFNIYCDESCHLESDNMPVMVWGGILCEERFAKEVSIDLRKIKQRHGLSPDFEAKWTKISPARVSFYEDLAKYFLESNRLSFRGLIVPDKSLIEHASRNQTHDEWYYKMYFIMLKYVITPPNHYRIYLDIKDTLGGPKSRKLHQFLANKVHDFSKTYVERVQHIRSHETEILQLTDLIIGAIQYTNRNIATSTAKLSIANYLRTHKELRSLTSTSSFGATKFNILVWNPQEERI